MNQKPYKRKIYDGYNPRRQVRAMLEFSFIGDLVSVLPIVDTEQEFEVLVRALKSFGLKPGKRE